MKILSPVSFGARLTVQNGSTNPDLMYFDASVLRDLALISEKRDELQKAVAEIDEGNKDRLAIRVWANQQDLHVNIDSEHNGSVSVQKEAGEDGVSMVKRAIERVKELIPGLKTKAEAEAPELNAAHQMLARLSGAIIGNTFEVIEKNPGSVLLKIGEDQYRISKSIRQDPEDESKDHVTYEIKKLDLSPKRIGFNEPWTESLGASRNERQELEIYSYLSTDTPSERHFARHNDIMQRKARFDVSKRMVLLQNQLLREIITTLEKSGVLQDPRIWT